MEDGKTDAVAVSVLLNEKFQNPKFISPKSTKSISLCEKKKIVESQIVTLLNMEPQNNPTTHLDIFQCQEELEG